MPLLFLSTWFSPRVISFLGKFLPQEMPTLVQLFSTTQSKQTKSNAPDFQYHRSIALGMPRIVSLSPVLKHYNHSDVEIHTENKFDAPSTRDISPEEPLASGDTGQCTPLTALHKSIIPVGSRAMGNTQEDELKSKFRIACCQKPRHS